MAVEAQRMTTISGFVSLRDPMRFVGVKGIRYIADLGNGWGFAAFDMERGEALQLPGRVLTIVEPHPDHPDTWPEWSMPTGPKRKIANGSERFILYDIPKIGSAFENLMALPDGYQGAAVVFDGAERYLRILVEADSTWDGQIEPIWDITPVDCWDIGYR